MNSFNSSYEIYDENLKENGDSKQHIYNTSLHRAPYQPYDTRMIINDLMTKYDKKLQYLNRQIIELKKYIYEGNVYMKQELNTQIRQNDYKHNKRFMLLAKNFNELNDTINKQLNTNNTFQMDHYLGKKLSKKAPKAIQFIKTKLTECENCKTNHIYIYCDDCELFLCQLCQKDIHQDEYHHYSKIAGVDYKDSVIIDIPNPTVLIQEDEIDDHRPEFIAQKEQQEEQQEPLESQQQEQQDEKQQQNKATDQMVDILNIKLVNPNEVEKKKKKNNLTITYTKT